MFNWYLVYHCISKEDAIMQFGLFMNCLLKLARSSIKYLSTLKYFTLCRVGKSAHFLNLSDMISDIFRFLKLAIRRREASRLGLLAWLGLAWLIFCRLPAAYFWLGFKPSGLFWLHSASSRAKPSQANWLMTGLWISDF